MAPVLLGRPRYKASMLKTQRAVLQWFLLSERLGQGPIIVTGKGANAQSLGISNPAVT